MNSVESAKEHILRFCKSKEQRIYAFKGQWGVGKSYLVRKLVSEGDERLPKYVSYVSVFGLGTIHEVQERMIGCLEQHQSILGGGMRRWIFRTTKFVLSKLSKAKPPIPYLPVELPDFSAAAFWHVAKKSDLLIVLDDLERANPSLQLEQLFGLASSITENSRAKVLLVFNDEKLTGEGPQALARLREKVIDGEFTLSPSITDLASAYLDEKSLVETVALCLKARGGPNIRLIQRVNRGVAALREMTAALNVSLDGAALVQVAKIIWYFHYSPVPPKDIRTLMVGIHGPWMAREGEFGQEELDEARRLGKQVGMRATALDGLILEYLHHGHVADGPLREFAEAEPARRREAHLQNEVWKVLGLYEQNFLASEAEIVAAAEQLLEAAHPDMNLDQMRILTELLGELKQPTADWWLRHVKAGVTSWTEETCKQYALKLSDPEVERLIQNRLDALGKAFDLKAAFYKVANQNWNDADMQRLSELPVSYYTEWFRTEGGDLLSPLRKALKLTGYAPDGTPESRLHSKLRAAVLAFEKKGLVNSLRVGRVLR